MSSATAPKRCARRLHKLLARLQRAKQFQLHACRDLFPHVPATEVPVALDMAHGCPWPGWTAKLVALLAGRATDRATLVEEVLIRLEALTTDPLAHEPQEGDSAGTIVTIAEHVPLALEARAIELARSLDTRGEARLALAATIDPREPAAALFEEAIEHGAGAALRAARRVPARFRRRFVEAALRQMCSRRRFVTINRKGDVARLSLPAKWSVLR